jgi:RNA polymerase sigma factor (sigma-70 family)
MTADAELLAAYIASDSHDAFDRLVQRHAPLVYSACFRVLGDRHDAEDAAQATFLIFARKAKALSPKTPLAVWLFRTATNAALNLRRTVQRRAEHERRSAAMEPARTEEADRLWEEIHPQIDEALAALPRRERDAVVLRYLAGKTEAEVSAELGCARGTVSSRLSRGLARLKKKLSRRGAVTSGGMLAAFLAGRTAEAVPAGLVSSIQSISIVTATGTAAGASAAAVTLSETVMKAMMLAKLKIAAIAVTAALAVGVTAPIAVSAFDAPPEPVPIQAQATPPPRAEPEPQSAPEPVPAATPKPARKPTPRVAPPGARTTKITARGAQLRFELNKFTRQGFRLVRFRRDVPLVIPAELRFRPVNLAKLIKATARFNRLKVAWYREHSVAVLYDGATDEEIARLAADLKAGAPARRRDAAWRARWVRDPRVLPLLAAAAADDDATVARSAWRSVHLGASWRVLALVCGSDALPAFRKALETKRPSTSARPGVLVAALAEIGGERILPLLEIAARSDDGGARKGAAEAAEKVGDERALALIRKLAGDKNIHTRRAAILALGRVGGEADLARIEKLRKHENEKVRSAALRALVFARRTPELVEQALLGKDWFARNAALTVLPDLDADAALALVKKALEDDNTRVGALAGIHHLGGKTALTLVRPLLGSESSRVRSGVASALYWIGIHEPGSAGAACGLLAEMANSEATDAKRDYGRVVALGRLARLSGARAIPILIKAAAGKKLHGQSSAVRALGEVGGKEAVTALKAILNRKKEKNDFLVKSMAARALGSVGTEEGFDVLAQVARSGEKLALRSVAITTIGRMGGHRAVPAFKNALGSKDLSPRHMAAFALGWLRSAETAGLIERAMKDKSSMARANAVSAARSALDGPRALPLLEKAMADDAASVRSRATTALTNIGGPRAVALLTKLVEDKDINVCTYALRGLVGLAPDQARPLVEKMLRHEDVAVRRAGIAALGSIGDDRALFLLEQAMDDKDANIRRLVVHEMRSFRTKAALALLERALSDKEAIVRQRVIATIWGFAHDHRTKVRAMLLAQLSVEKDKRTRTAIVNKLKQLFPNDPVVKKALGSAR